MTAPDYFADLEAWKAEAPRQTESPRWLAQHHRPLLAGTRHGHRRQRFGQRHRAPSAGPAHLGRLTQAADGAVTFSLPTAARRSGWCPTRSTRRSSTSALCCWRSPRSMARTRCGSATPIRGPAALPPIRVFPAKPEWRIVADWIRLDQPLGMTVDTTKSIPTEVEITHKAVFTHDGRQIRTDPHPRHVRVAAIRAQGPDREATRLTPPPASSSGRTSPTARLSSISTRPSIRPAPSPSTPSARCRPPKTSCRSGSRPVKSEFDRRPGRRDFRFQL